MSRTDAHTPLHIRVARGDIGHVELHDHTTGTCDLPPRGVVTKGFAGRRLTRCRWEWRYDGARVCPCELCHEGSLHRTERRRSRHEARRDARRAVREWNAAGADVR